MELRNTEHGQNTGRIPEDWRNTGTLMGQRNTGETIGILQQRNNGTKKQHQEILSIQNDDILSRSHSKIQNKKIILARRIFMEKLNLVRRQFPCNKSTQENEK